MCAQREFTIPISTKCPSGGSKTIRPSDDNPAVVYVRADGRGGINCSRTSGCGKRHSKNDFKGDPVILKIFDDAVNYYKKSNTTQSSEIKSNSTTSISPTQDAPKKGRGRPRNPFNRAEHAKELQPKKEAFFLAAHAIAQSYQKEVESAARPANYKKANVSSTLKLQLWTKIYGDDIYCAKCPICEIKKICRDDYQMGHIFPEACGGSPSSMENLIPICDLCNNRMGEKHLYWWAWDEFKKIFFDFSHFMSTAPTPAPTAASDPPPA
jgi:5-methylcytosine-specific restriction endonuclease McrA